MTDTNPEGFDEVEPGESLKERIEQIGNQAEANYDIDPVLSLINYFHDTERDLEEIGVDSEGFLSGYRQAIHDTTAIYITYSGEFDCECNGRPAPEQTGDRSWRCADCEAFLSPDLRETRSSA